MSTLSVSRIIDVAEVFQRASTLDTAKNCLLVYLLAKRALKLWRHVRARGIIRSIREFYVFIAQVFPISLPPFPSTIETPSFFQRSFRLVIKLPSLRKAVDAEMDVARAEMAKLLPQGKDVVRHLALPKRGCTLEWILDSMEQMDQEAPSHTDYRDGKLSGAVYRAQYLFLLSSTFFC